MNSHRVVWAGYASGIVTRGDGNHEQVVADNGAKLGAIAGFYEGTIGFLVSGQRGMAVLRGEGLGRLRFFDNLLAENVTGGMNLTLESKGSRSGALRHGRHAGAG